MRRKTEDQLAKFAFGDLTAEEASSLQASLQDDAEANRTLDMYSRMKVELQSLCTDVPEDQLSKERLREAILTRGLKEHRAEPARPNWLWMPAAAAVLAFGVVFAKGKLQENPSTSPMVVDNSKPRLELPSDIRIVRPPVSEKVASTARTPLIVNTPPMTVAVNTDRGSRNLRSGTDDLEDRRPDEFSSVKGIPRLMAFEAPQSDHDMALSGQPVIFESKKESAPSRPQPSSLDQPAIVVIQSETDADTGALKATEVRNTANVVVGG
ncbi:MAG: hypothetical protein H7Y17_07240 [Chlorobia bacterium]|nr:hypothetical protein [Fimbriimonadaceae bacterium]